jgi:hypothetical protein
MTLQRLARLDGLVGGYTFEQDGSRAPRSSAVGRWQAAGSRWLPIASEPPAVPPA